jgi:hypothetical protein
MPLKTLIVIALRLYAIYWLVQGLSTLLIYLPMLLTFMWDASASSAKGMQGLYSFILIPPSMLAFAVLLWFLSSRLSSAVTKGHDTQLAFTSLTKEDFYLFAFVFLGLFFALSSIFSIVETGYQFFALGFPQPDNNPQKWNYLWPFLGHIFTMIAGFVCVLGARKWTNKLIRLDDKCAEPAPSVV